MTPAPVAFCQSEAKSPKRAARRPRRSWPALFSLVGALVGTGAAGCDSSQFVLVTVQDLPTAGNVVVRTYYGLDSQPSSENAADVTPPLNQFAVMLPGDGFSTYDSSQASTYSA